MPDVGGTSSADVAPSSEGVGGASSEETRRRAMDDRLRNRDNQRLEALEAKRLAREETSAEHENVQFFSRQFHVGADVIARDISDASDPTKVDETTLPSHFESVNEAVQKLTKYLADSKLFLPTYDLRKSQEKIDSLNESLSAARNALLPKKKFGFKNKTKAKAVTPAPGVDRIVGSEAPDSIKPVTMDPVVNVERDEGDFVIKDQTKRSLCVPENLDGRVVGLFRLEDSDVLLRGSPSAIHVRGLRRCRVFAGPTSGSVFVDRCDECVFVVACQQLRIHTSKDTSFYIHVTSKAIVEDCTTVSFGPYNLSYPGLDADYVTSGLDRSRNNWRHIDDFNFLATETASPNWRLLADDEQTTDWSKDLEKLMHDTSKETSLDGGSGDNGS